MLIFIVKRIGLMLLTMVAVSILVFLLLEVNVEGIAIKVLGPYTSEEQRRLWLEQNGFLEPFYIRYFTWLGSFITGEFGDSIRFKVPVADVLWPRLLNTAILGGCTYLFMIPLALTLGILAGMKEGSGLDRTISVASIVTTSVPEFASAVLFSALFVFYLGWLPGTSGMVGGPPSPTPASGAASASAC